MKEQPLRHDANDHTPEALAAAAHNWKLVIDDWCTCPPSDECNQVYYRSPRTGSHGWMCAKCRKITQTG